MASGEERQVPQCPTCQVNLSVGHILIDCPHFAGQRRANGLSGLSLATILGNDFNNNLFKFLKEINLFYDI